MGMQESPGLASAEYTVVSVKAARQPGAPAPAEPNAPPEILERFEGRTFSLHELEQRGVRIAGGQAVYSANGADWLLEIWPKLGG